MEVRVAREGQEWGSVTVGPLTVSLRIDRRPVAYETKREAEVALRVGNLWFLEARVRADHIDLEARRRERERRRLADEAYAAVLNARR